MYSESIFRGQHHHLLPLRGEMQDNSHHHLCQETAMRGTLTWKAFPSAANFTLISLSIGVVGRLLSSVQEYVETVFLELCWYCGVQNSFEKGHKIRKDTRQSNGTEVPASPFILKQDYR